MRSSITGLKMIGNLFRSLSFVGIGLMLLSSCADRIEDISGDGALSSAVGQCIEVIYPFRIFPEGADAKTDLLVVNPPGSVTVREGGVSYPAGTHLEISRFVLIHALDNTYFFVYGNIPGETGKRQVSLVELIDVEWISDSAEQLRSGRSPVLPPTGLVPLNVSYARSCQRAERR